MKTLIDHIDSCLSSCTPAKYYGLCKLVLDDKGESYPRTVGKEATKVTPNDNYKVLIYHRLLDGDFADSETFSFGRSVSRANAQRIRMVVVVDIAKDREENFVNNIINAFPDDISNTDYKFSSVGTSFSLIRDQAVWTQEWANAYKDKYQMRYNIYAVEYTLEYIQCDVTC